MENYPRTAMHIPFEEYQKKITEKQQSSNESDVGTDGLGGGKPAAIIGEIYPDLRSQAAYINKDIADIKATVVESVKGLFGNMGEEAVKLSLDSIYDYVESFLALSREASNPDEEYSFTRKGLITLTNQVYSRVDLAKTLLDLYLNHRRLMELDDRLKLTKRNILL